MRKVNYLLTIILFFKVAKESHKEHLVSSSYQITLYYQSTNHFSGKKQRQNFTEDHLHNSAANLMTMIFSKEAPTDYVALCQGLSRGKILFKGKPKSAARERTSSRSITTSISGSPGTQGNFTGSLQHHFLPQAGTNT